MPSKTEKAYRTMTVKKMKALGVYRKEFDDLIAIYAQRLHELDVVNEQFIASGEKYEVSTGTGGTKRAPLVAIMEDLRKEIYLLSDRLCLNPKAAGVAAAPPSTSSKLDQALEALAGSLNDTE